MTKNFKTAMLVLAAGTTMAAAAPASASLATGSSAAPSVLSVGQAGWNHGRHWDNDGYNDYGDRRRYRESSYYDGPVWRGRDGRYRCRRSDGTVGLLIGGAVGGVIGHEIVGRRGDKTAGTILGVAGGALIGRAIDRNGSRCR